MAQPDAAEHAAASTWRSAAAELSRILVAAQPLSASLARLARVAKDTVPGAADVSVTLVQGRRVRSVVGTGPLAVQLDAQQYESGFGPCLAAAVSGETVRIDDTTDESVHRDFARQARRRGITGVLSVGLPIDHHVVGALTVYCTGSGPLDDAVTELAQGFARYVAIVLANAGAFAEGTERAEHLQASLASRALVEQARGVLMAWERCTADEAFDRLCEQARRTDRAVREVAGDVVATTRLAGAVPVEDPR